MDVELDEAFWSNVRKITIEISNVLNKHKASYPTAGFVLADLLAVWTVGANGARGRTSPMDDLEACASISAQAMDNIEQIRGRDGGLTMQDILQALHGKTSGDVEQMVRAMPSRPTKPGKTPWGWE